MPFADDMENGVKTLGSVAQMSAFKLTAAAILVCGIGLLRLADAISAKGTATKEKASELPMDKPPGVE